MSKMKKFIAGFIGLNLILPLNLASAQLENDLEVFPGSDVEVSFELSTENNSISNLVDKAFQFAIEEEDNLNSIEQNVLETFQLALQDTKIQGILSNDEQLIKVNSSTEVQTEMNEMIEELGKFLQITKEEFEGVTLYQIKGEDFVFAYSNKSILISSTLNQLKANISDLENFVSVDLNSDEILNFELALDGNTSNVSISEPSKEQFVISSEASYPGKSLDNFNSGSHLYDKVPAQKPIMYLEFNNMLDIIELSSDELEEIGIPNLSEMITTELALELPETSKALNNQVAFLIDRPENGLVIPNITLAIDEVNETMASELNTEINNLVAEAIEETEGDEEVSITKSNISSNLQKVEIKFNSEELGLENSESLEKELSEGITFTYGLQSGAFLLSTDKDIAETFGQKNLSISQTEGIQSLPKNNSGSISVSFISFNEVAEWINNIQLALGEEDSAEFDNLVGFYQVQDILKEMKTWTGFSYAKGEKIAEESNIHVPLDLIFEIIESQPEGESDIFEFETFEDFSFEFDDVDYENDWYAEYVEQALDESIITTFDQETFEFINEFKASEEITRAEFIDMIVRAYDLYYVFPEQNGSDIFSDVEAGAWYDETIGIAYENGIINGDDTGNTVRPNDTLNRAEAVQILYNISPILVERTSNSEEFDDVENNDWFHNVVSVAVDAQVIEGVNPSEFAPAKKLNRAEAITMLIRLVNNEVRF